MRPERDEGVDPHGAAASGGDDTAASQQRRQDQSGLHERDVPANAQPGPGTERHVVPSWRPPAGAHEAAGVEARRVGPGSARRCSSQGLRITKSAGTSTPSTTSGRAHVESSPTPAETAGAPRRRPPGCTGARPVNHGRRRPGRLEGAELARQPVLHLGVLGEQVKRPGQARRDGLVAGDHRVTSSSRTSRSLRPPSASADRRSRARTSASSSRGRRRAGRAPPTGRPRRVSTRPARRRCEGWAASRQHGRQRAACPSHHHLQGGVDRLDEALTLAARSAANSVRPTTSIIVVSAARSTSRVSRARPPTDPAGPGRRPRAAPRRRPGARDGRRAGDPAAAAPHVAVGGQQALAGDQAERAVLHGALAVAAVVVLEHPARAVRGVHEQHGRARQGEGDQVPVPLDGAFEEGERVARMPGTARSMSAGQRPVDRQGV